MIGSIASYSSTSPTGSISTSNVVTTSSLLSETTRDQDASGQNKSTATISTLASQLADSASRAEERDKTLSRSELTDKAKRLLNQISGDSYQINKEKYDSDVPKTDDPVLLSRAKQATEFVNRSSNHGGEKNPFAGLSREQLSNIIYDDSGTYTVNERRAAWMEASEQEEEWRSKVIAQVIEEYNRSGKMAGFFKEVLEHFKSLPAIEQAQYPKDYSSDLESKIKTDFNYRTNQAEGKSQMPHNLIDAVLKPSPSQRKRD